MLSEDPADLNLQYMRELKTVVPDAVRAYADTYSALVNEGVTFTSGSASAINAHADLYDAILNPFGAQDASEVVFTDIAEDDPAYEDLRYVFENGLMKPVDEVSFGSENEATVGELAGALTQRRTSSLRLSSRFIMYMLFEYCVKYARIMTPQSTQ